MKTSMTAAPARALPRIGGTALDVDRLLETVTGVLAEVPPRRRFEELSMVGFLALYARRQHGGDLAAADRSLRGALERLGNPHQQVTPASLSRRIQLSRRSIEGVAV